MSDTFCVIKRDQLKDMARGLLYMPTDWPEDRDYFLRLSSSLLDMLKYSGDFVLCALESENAQSGTCGVARERD